VGNAPAARYELVKLATEAKQALVTLKFPKQIARDAVTAALERVGPNTTLEQLIREALRSLRATS
jgi:Holliday junction resolvasome RuvABC DNA-binding subunit